MDTTKPAPNQPTNQPAPKLIEVELRRKYTPHFVVHEDGSFEPNNPKNMETIAPGIVKMHPKDAGIVLRSEDSSGSAPAQPTHNTFRDMAG